MGKKVSLNLAIMALSCVVSCATNPFINHSYVLMEKGKIERDTLEREGYTDAKAKVLLKSVQCIFMNKKYSEANQKAFMEELYRNRFNEKNLSQLLESCEEERYTKTTNKISDTNIELRYNELVSKRPIQSIAYGSKLQIFKNDNFGVAECRYTEYGGASALLLGLSGAIGFAHCTDIVKGKHWINFGTGLGLSTGLFGQGGIRVHDDSVLHYRYSPVTLDMHSLGDSNAIILGWYDKKDKANKKVKGSLLLGLGFITWEGYLRLGAVIWPTFLFFDDDGYMLNVMRIVFYSSEAGFNEVLNELKLAEEKKSKEQKEK